MPSSVLELDGFTLHLPLNLLYTPVGRTTDSWVRGLAGQEGREGGAGEGRERGEGGRGRGGEGEGGREGTLFCDNEDIQQVTVVHARYTIQGLHHTLVACSQYCSTGCSPAVGYKAKYETQIAPRQVCACNQSSIVCVSGVASCGGGSVMCPAQPTPVNGLFLPGVYL